MSNEKELKQQANEKNLLSERKKDNILKYLFKNTKEEF